MSAEEIRQPSTDRDEVVDGLSEARCTVNSFEQVFEHSPAGVTSTPTSAGARGDGARPAQTGCADRVPQPGDSKAGSVRGRAVTDESASSEGGSDATVRRPRGRAAGTGGGCRWGRG